MTEMCTTLKRNLINFGHMSGAGLLENPALDGFVGPYSYSPNTRRISGAYYNIYRLFSHGYSPFMGKHVPITQIQKV